jgi:ribokinase
MPISAAADGSASAGPSVVVVGSINIDVTVVVDRLPSPGETVLAGSLERTPGGKGANQAAAAAQLLGGRVTLVGAVGDDEDGRWILARLADLGVDTAHVAVAPGRSTGTASITVDAAGENTIAVHPAANDAAYAEGMSLPDADGYVLSLEIPLDAAMLALSDMRGFVCVNASPAGRLPDELVARADLIVVNETEFAAMPELSAAAEVVETIGGDGVRIHRKGRLVAEIPAVAVDRIVSTVGAGDAFCAALVVGRLSGMSTEDAARTAAHVGADAVGQPEAQPSLRRLSHYARAMAEPTAGASTNAPSV